MVRRQRGFLGTKDALSLHNHNDNTNAKILHTDWIIQPIQGNQLPQILYHPPCRGMYLITQECDLLTGALVFWGYHSCVFLGISDCCGSNHWPKTSRLCSLWDGLRRHGGVLLCPQAKSRPKTALPRTVTSLVNPHLSISRFRADARCLARSFCCLNISLLKKRSGIAARTAERPPSLLLGVDP